MQILDATWFRSALAIGTVIVSVISFPSSTGAAEPVASGESAIPGLELGSKAPTFVLSDQNGKQQTLSQLLKKGNVALVFYRSADW